MDEDVRWMNLLTKFYNLGVSAGHPHGWALAIAAERLREHREHEIKSTELKIRVMELELEKIRCKK